MEHKKGLLLISIVGIVLAGSVLGLLVYSHSKNQRQSSVVAQKPISQSTSKPAARSDMTPNTKQPSQLGCEAAWKKYTNDVLGIAFCYPESWGAPRTQPIENLTTLRDAVKQYSDGGENAYKHSIFIEFTANPAETFGKVRLRFFNEQYAGEFYKNVNAHRGGYADNIEVLKKSGNICDFKTEFNQPSVYPNTLKEIWTECYGNVKTTIIEDTEHFDFLPSDSQVLYSYDLNSYGYRRLKNFFFDNLLVQSSHEHIVQLKKPLRNFEEFFSAEKAHHNSIRSTQEYITKDQYLKEKVEFAKFLDSIIAFQPVTAPTLEFQSVPGEEISLTKIRKYYWLLSNGKIDEAYAMHQGSAGTIDEFRSRYGKIKSAVPRGFISKENGRFEFYVDYQDHNEDPTLFHVIMNVSDVRMVTELSEEITTEMVKFGDYTAYGKHKGSKMYMVLLEKGQERIVDEGEDGVEREIAVTNFWEPRFSANGQYLIFGKSGWEWMSSSVYDIEKEEITVTAEGPEVFEFTTDKKFFYTCGSAGMGQTNAGKIYAVPGFRLLFDVMGDEMNQQYASVSCKQDSVKGTITFTLTDGTAADKIVVYSLTDKKVL